MAFFKLAFLFRKLHQRRFEKIAEQEFLKASPSTLSGKNTINASEIDTESLVDHKTEKRCLKDIFSMENFVALMEKQEQSEGKIEEQAI